MEMEGLVKGLVTFAVVIVFFVVVPIWMTKSGNQKKVDSEDDSFKDSPDMRSTTGKTKNVEPSSQHPRKKERS